MPGMVARGGARDEGRVASTKYLPLALTGNGLAVILIHTNAVTYLPHFAAGQKINVVNNNK